MDAVRADLASASSPASNVVPISTRARPSRSYLPYAAMAAALVIAIFSGYSAYTAHTENEANRQQLAVLQARVEAQERAASTARAELALNQSRLADLIAPGAAQFPVDNGVVVRSGDRVLIALRRLPALPKGKVYQAWTLRRGAKAVAPSITFVPDATGLALIELPTTKPSFVRPLS